jgi:transposase, IS5 family
MNMVRKKRAPAPVYVSPNQLSLDCFKTPFEQHLNKDNRWVVLAHIIPWDEICNLYLKHVGISNTGRPPLSPRLVIGSLIIKHICNLDDRETVDQISENMYMQYFLGYSSFTPEAPFDASLFVEFRKRLGMDSLNQINERIVALKTGMELSRSGSVDISVNEHGDPSSSNTGGGGTPNKGRVIFDATACPQDIAYPTDLDLLSTAREKSEQLIDILHDPLLHGKKPRTYRLVARKRYLRMAQKRNKPRKELRKSIGSQLRFLRRNLNAIKRLLEPYTVNPLKKKDCQYLETIRTVYQQQKKMYDTKTHTVGDRIVSIHQPHVRPIVRGKTPEKVEFGSKIHVSLIDGICFLDELSWDAFNEGAHMMEYVKKYKQRFGFYPRELLADKIYCTRKNRADLKELGTRLIAKPLGRPSAVQIHVRPGERNPIEGKFGQAKTGYGLDRIKARLKETSESWIASIILVLNLVKLAGVALLCYIIKLAKSFSASAWDLLFTEFAYRELIHCSSYVKKYESNRVKYKIAA